MKNIIVSLITVCTLWVFSLPVQAGETKYVVKGESSKSQNGCVPFVSLFGDSCSSNQASVLDWFGAPAGLGSPTWAGPFYGGGFFKQGTAPGISDLGATIPGGKEAPSLNGKITIDDQGDADPTNDVIGGQMTVGKTTLAYSGGQNGPFEEASWNKLVYTIAAKTADSATPNAFGGVDYVIGSLGMPETLVEIGLQDADDDDFAEPGGPGSPAPSEIGAGGIGFYQAPGVFNFNPTVTNDTPGIASYESMQPSCFMPNQIAPPCALKNIGTTATAAFTNFRCVDVLTGGGCDLTGAGSIGVDPDIDNLTMFISTDGAGKILKGFAFASREFDITTIGNLFGGPDGITDSMNYTTWTFTYSK
jgi:hypothetical protein